MITINRNNYEHYFLLWVDGELSTEEMEAVERFIAEHPDLAEELALFQEVKLVPEAQIVFTNKAQLFKHSADEINLNNYETWFLLFVDNELSIDDRQRVELFVLQHPSVQKEFELIQQAKLPDEKWVFNHKSALYKKEAQKRPVVYMRWMRYAAAAAVIGLIATVWMIAPTNQLKSPLEINGVQPEVVGTQPVINSDETETTNAQTLKNRVEQIDPKTSIQAPTSLSKAVTDEPQTGSNALVTIIDNETIKKEELTVTRIAQNPVQSVKTVPASNLVAGRNDIDNNQGANIEPADSKAEDALEEIKTVYTALEDTDEDKSLYIGALEINKDKLRGFFRKAGTIFRSKAKQEEDTRQQK